MFECTCGKTYKTKKPYLKHFNNCDYANKSIERMYSLGYMIHEAKPLLFRPSISTAKKLMKSNNLNKDEALIEAQKQSIYEYRRSLWDILVVFEHTLLPSEYRLYIKWAIKTYPNIFLESLRNVLGSTKILYRFNMEYNATTIKNRINSSILYIHEYGEFINDYDFADAVAIGDISLYYIMFNTWLAETWFGQLDLDLQNELTPNVETVLQLIIDRVNHKEFDELQALADSVTPIIHRI